MSVIFGRFNQLTGLRRNHSKAAHKDNRNENEEGSCEIADLKLPEHEGKQCRRQKQQPLLNLNGLVDAQIAKNHSGHRQTDGKHHNSFDHADLLEMLGFLTRTAAMVDFSVTWPEGAYWPWGCQVDPAEQRVGFFSQELRLINLQRVESTMAAEAQKICLIGDRRRK